MITISWKNFDKAFWLTAKNMRNLINFTIQIGGITNSLEQRQDKAEADIAKNAADIQSNIINTNTVASTANKAAADVELLRSEYDVFKYAVNTDIQTLASDISQLKRDVEEHWNKYP